MLFIISFLWIEFHALKLVVHVHVFMKTYFRGQNVVQSALFCYVFHQRIDPLYTVIYIYAPHTTYAKYTFDSQMGKPLAIYTKLYD